MAARIVALTSVRDDAHTEVAKREQILSHRISLLVLVASLFVADSLAAQTDFSWQNCGPASAPVQVTSLKVTPEPPPTPAPLAITASFDTTTGQITNLHGFLLFGGLPFQLDSGPVSSAFANGFVALPGAIPMAVKRFNAYQAYGLPANFPIKANVYSTPSSGVPFVFPDGVSLDTVVSSGFTKVDLTPTNLLGASVGLSFNGGPGFPVPAQAGDYAAEVELLGMNGTELGCLLVNLGTSFVACLDSVSASPNMLWPPNHQMTPVTISISPSNGCIAGSCMITSVSSNEPAGSDAVASGDAVITGNLTVSLRADRTGNDKSGRVYTVTLECTDASDNSSSKAVRRFGASRSRAVK